MNAIITKDARGFYTSTSNQKTPELVLEKIESILNVSNMDIKRNVQFQYNHETGYLKVFPWGIAQGDSYYID